MKILSFSGYYFREKDNVQNKSELNLQFARFTLDMVMCVCVNIFK